MIDKLIAAGMNCARLNFSHGDHESHGKVAKAIRDGASRARKPVAILADLCGPKMRIGKFPGGPIELVNGQKFTFTTEEIDGDQDRVSVSYKPLPQDVKPDDIILLDDGLLRLRVLESTDTDVICEVEVGGALSDRKGLNLPGATLSTPALTEKDKQDLAFAVDELRVDFVALSFVRSAVDVEECSRLSKGTPVIAKMEKPEAIENMVAILDAADGVMVARGDLGVEIGSEKVPMVQKRLIREANHRGKFVITATQMLDSMMRNPRPTRAEAADVANAVLDGTGAVMLSGETASGKYPLESVQMMDAIVREVEDAWIADPLSTTTESSLERDFGDWAFSNAAARAAALLSFHLPLKALVVFTASGRTAGLLSDYRPKAPIIAITADSPAANRMALQWGIDPFLEVPPETPEEALRLAATLLIRSGRCRSGDPIAMVVGWPTSARPNTVKLHRL